MLRLLGLDAPRQLLGCVVFGTLALPAPARADDEPIVVPIVVTARRIDERPIDVPLAVDVVPADAIGPGGVDSLQSLAAKIPGLSFEAGWGGFFSSPVLRGQSQPSPLSRDSVGVFIDGVYQANRDAVDSEPLDLERIEVIHGPQSALFGHSSFAGLIHFVPAEPAESLLVSGAGDFGTDDLRGIRAIVSGPLNGLVKARLAATYRAADGTHQNAALPGENLGNSERFAIAASLATRDGSGPLSARLSARYGQSRSNQPALFTLDYRHYNCGGRDPASGVWSYFCGKAPIASQVSISTDISDSRTRGGQAALHLALETGGVELRSDSSFYQAEVSDYRDFDGSAEGELYGVCVAGLNCNGIGSLTMPVVRLQRVSTVQRRSASAREIAQELRIRSSGDSRFGWQIGGTVFWTRVRNTFAYGAGRGALATSERFSSLVLSNPQRVGAPAAINFAVVSDPNASQVIQLDEVQDRRTIALFATADYRLTEGLRLRGEVRSNWERLDLDSRRANFLPSFGIGLGARNFHDITPRIGIDWRPADGWLAFASYARGSRSGGLNIFPNLLPEEQTFEPETNWTGEIGVKYFGSGVVRSARVTAYDIDWDNTQIIGLSTTPGVTAQIQRNTTGIHTQGIEIGAELAPARWLRFDFAYSYANPRFKAGSEDPGGNPFCGLALGVTTSSFCTIRPSRIDPGQLVADISGNVPARAVRTSWTAGVTVSPMLHGLRFHAEVSRQGNVFDRQINGLYYGARTLLGARVSIPLGPCSMELWGTNLGDARYASFAAGRPPVFYTGIPRPTDLVLGERRRIGLTLRFSH